MSRTGCQSETGLKRSLFNETLADRFAAKCGGMTDTGCIPWTGTKTKKGYGVIQVAGGGTMKTTAHRISWVLKHGDLAPNVLVLHKCDNPKCVNVEHLFIGSAQENTEDMVSKKRHAWRERTPWQKLSTLDGIRVLALRKSGKTQQQVADLFGVSRPLISMIENGKFKYVQPSLCA